MRHLQCMDHFRPHGHLAMKVAFTFITTVLKKDDIMSVKKVELLAPAGDFACFRAAVNAGADAVYLGGGQYGARAYATNFTAEELQKALRIAHLFGRKIYLTVNTLVKEQEFANLIPYIQPLYETGLDGVIIQDMGVLQCLRENFPKLELHASTQMTVTGIYGAAYLKNLECVVLCRQGNFLLTKFKISKKRQAWKWNALCTVRCVMPILGSACLVRF